MPFYEGEAAKNGFEAGVRAALEAILASPYFIFRLEKAPTDARSGGTYRVADIDLASRLSFFLWGEPPDQELIAAARPQGAVDRRRAREAGAAHARRSARRRRWPSASPRSGCACRTSTRSIPIRTSIPNFDENLADAMRTETKLFFNSLVQGRSQPARSLSRRLHVPERAARAALRHHRRQRHRVPPRHLSRRRRAAASSARAAMLVQTLAGQSHLAGAARQVGDGSAARHAAAAAAAGRPAISTKPAKSKDGRLLTTRERMEMHRTNPTCNSCHRFMDPIGLALDNFDVTGAVARCARTACRSTPRGDFYDGTKVDLAGRADRGAAEAADAAGAHLHREPDGLRARPPRRVLRPAGGSRDREGAPKRTTTRCRRSSWASSRATRSGCGEWNRKRATTETTKSSADD